MTRLSHPCNCGDPTCPTNYGWTREAIYRARKEYDMTGDVSPKNYGPGDQISGPSASDLRFSDLSSNNRNNIPSFQKAVADLMRDIDPDFARAMGLRSRDIRYIGPSEAPPVTDGSKPPASYTSARKEVEDWIITADPEVSWSSIIGNKLACDELLEAIEAPVKDKELYESLGVVPPKGVLLYGPPGCGKTMFAKATASALSSLYKTNAELLLINGSEITNKYLGESEANVRRIFAYAREYRAHHSHPLVIFIDECDVLLPTRTGDSYRFESAMVAQFLAELDGIRDYGAFVILATNRPEAVDEAVLRDGRCDRKIKVTRPTQDDAKTIIENSFAGKKLADPLPEIINTAVESLYDPAKIIKHGAIIFSKKKYSNIHFCLSDVVSGALAASIGPRSASAAFKRNKAAGTTTGISVTDVIAATQSIFEENLPLEHNFALREWIDALPIEALGEDKGTIQ